MSRKATYLLAFRNGDINQKEGIKVIIEPSDDLQAVLNRASSRLSRTAPVQYTRIFCQNGGELVDIGDIQDGENLIFSVGEDRVGVPTTTRTVVDGKEAEKKQFLQHIATAAVVQASQIYDSTSSYIAAKSPEFVKVTLEKVQGRVATVANPVARKVKEYGQPMLEWADGRIDSAYTRVSRVSRKSRELPAEVVKTINENYVLPVLLPIQHKVQDASTAFVHAAADSWHALQTSAHDGRVKLDAFIDGMKLKLGATWNERLVDPAKTLFSSAQKELSEVMQQQPDKGKIASIFINVKSKLGETWEQKVKTNLPTTVNQRVVEPAEAFLKSAQEAYRNLAVTSSGAGVSFSEFLIALRGRVGSAWNTRLVDPARYIYDKFHGDPRSLENEGKSSEDDGDAPPNTASPMPTTLSDSPQGSGMNTPAEPQQVIYPTDVVEDEEPAQDVLSTPIVSDKPAKSNSKKSSTGGKKKKNVKKKSSGTTGTIEE